MKKFETIDEILAFIKDHQLKRGFYKKGNRVQWLIGFDGLGFMRVTTAAQVRKGRNGEKYSFHAWNLKDEANLPKVDWFLKAEFLGDELEVQDES
ncbi:hypothetical protein VNN36_00705 [Lactococcus garvieae]|uniref:hypothetical protein n=1 Tax=Lactococcus garvieae TaxID=1363 RepID=UPI0030CCA34E